MRRRPPVQQPAGVALVVTLMMMSVLTMMVVGLAGVMRNEQAAARNLTYQVLAEQMAEIGAREAMARVLNNSPVGTVPSVTGPGWMLNNGTLVPLFSSNAANRMVDLERLGTNSMILGVNSNQVGSIRADWTNVVPPAATANFPVGRYAWWVDDEGTKANLNQVGGDKASASATTSLLPLQTNFPLSASPVFVDDPVNGTGNNGALAARMSTRSNAVLTPELLKLATASGGIGLTTNNYRSFKGNITVWSSNSDVTPWGAPRINLADLGVTDAASRDAAYNTLRTALKSAPWAGYFPAGSLARKYGGGGAAAASTGNHGDLTIDQIAANLVAAATTNQYPIQCTQFQPASGNTAVDRFRNGLPLTLSSDHLGPYLTEVWVRIDAITANSIQTFQARGGTRTNILASAGSVRMGMMVRLTNPYSQPMANFRLEIQPRKFRFKLLQDTINYENRNPLPAPTLAQLATPLTQGAGAPTLSANALGWVTLEGRANSPLGWWLGPEWLKDRGGTMRIFPWDLGQIFSRVLSDADLTDPPIFSKTINFQMNVNAAGALNAAGLVNETFVQIDQVRLVDTANGNRLVDWMSMDDLAQDGNFRSTTSLTETIDPAEDYGQLPFGVSGGRVNANLQRAPAPTITLPTLTSNSFTAANATGIFRTDPRVRFPLSHWDTSGTQRGVLRSGGWPATVKAWTINASVAGRRTSTGLSFLSPDPVPDPTDEPHPHFISGYFPANGLRSVAQLGAIHTGLPWRTLRFLPTLAAELAQGPPDWVLLDLFTVTNAAATPPMINVNSVGLERGAGEIRISGDPAHRAWAVMTPMVGLTNSQTGFFRAGTVSNNLAAWGVPTAFASDRDARMSVDDFALMGTSLAGALATPARTGNWYTGATAAQSSDWGNFRSTADDLWPKQGLAFRGELAELAAFNQDDADLSEEQQEGRLRFFVDLLTTRSDTFTVWSAGQGLLVFTNALGQVRTNVMGEVRKQTVFQRVPQTNATGAITGWQVKVLYSRNHVVE